MNDRYLLKIMAEALRDKARVHANAKASGHSVDPIAVLNEAADELNAAAGGAIKRARTSNRWQIPVKYFELVANGELKSIGHQAGATTFNLQIERIDDIDQVIDGDGKPIVGIMEGITIRIIVESQGMPWNDTNPTVTH
jgi:hypothetical protein